MPSDASSATKTAKAAKARANVTSDIREAILRGDFVAGQRLVEADLTEQFSASRGAVRSALLELAAEGLVERIANRGARVRIVPLDEAIEIYEVRMAVEALCAAKAAERIGAAEAEELRTIGSDMRVAVTCGDIMRYRQLNQRLHQRIREISGQRAASDVLERLRAQSVRQQFKVATMPGRPQVSLPEHLAIIDAICAGDADAAEQAIRLHLGSVMEAMRRASES
ncbi:GntR family transcriptional regulator [Streptomyces xinghaiensis]|uniref:GntR family transcriptional regulator n=1 Tax=Streptomyces xinghaiensis TaxID=1038928 RepID=UPI0037B86B14